MYNKRNGEKNTVSVTPEKNDSGYYLIGITSSNYVKTNVFETAAYSAYNVKYWINLTIDSLKQLVTGRIGVDQLSGPVGVVSAVDTTYKESKSGGALLIFLNLLQMTILLSANLGVMNLLPLPALDGRSSGISDRGSDPRKAGASGKRRVCTSGRNGTFSLPDGICDV